MSRISVLIGSVPPQGDAPIDEIFFQPDHEWIRAVEHRPKIQNGLAGGEVAETHSGTAHRAESKNGRLIPRRETDDPTDDVRRPWQGSP